MSSLLWFGPSLGLGLFFFFKMLGTYPSTQRLGVWPLIRSARLASCIWCFAVFLNTGVVLGLSPQSINAAPVIAVTSLVSMCFFMILGEKLGVEGSLEIQKTEESLFQTRFAILIDEVLIGHLSIAQDLSGSPEFSNGINASFKGVSTGPVSRLYRLIIQNVSSPGPVRFEVGLLALVDTTKRLGSVPKRYLLSVPPNILNVQEALAWTFGMKEEEYSPVLES